LTKNKELEPDIVVTDQIEESLATNKHEQKSKSYAFAGWFFTHHSSLNWVVGEAHVSEKKFF